MVGRQVADQPFIERQRIARVGWKLGKEIRIECLGKTDASYTGANHKPKSKASDGGLGPTTGFDVWYLEGQHT